MLACAKLLEKVRTLRKTHTAPSVCVTPFLIMIGDDLPR